MNEYTKEMLKEDMLNNESVRLGMWIAVNDEERGWYIANSYGYGSISFDSLDECYRSFCMMLFN